MSSTRRTRSRPTILATIGLAVSGVADLASAQCTNPWQPSGGLAGTDNAVFAVSAWDPDGPGPATARLAAGGSFTVAGGAIANHVAAYDPASNLWTSLGIGTNAWVRALAS